MIAEDPCTLELLRRAASGDEGAWSELVDRYGEQLRRTAGVLLDGRVRGRLGPEDVVQEVLADAFQSLDDYLADLRLPFTVWLRQKVRERVHRSHRDHLHTRKRSAGREVGGWRGAGAESWLGVFETIAATGTTPSGHAARDELVERVRSVLAGLSPIDREILMLLYVEGHSQPEASVILGVSPGAVRVRHFRAVSRMAEVMRSMHPGWSP